MFTQELDTLTELVMQALDQLEVPHPPQIQWAPIPFSGQWGVGTTVAYQVAALESKQGKEVQVSSRAAQIADLLASQLQLQQPPPGIRSVQSERAYLNAYFDTPTFAGRVVDRVLEFRADFGRGPVREERVMVEYAQPNTHHSFHIGHLRNAVLGECLARLVEFAGFETIRASYPGDIGLGVITCMWAYDKFYRGQEPAGVHERGQWLLKIYIEANEMLTPGEEESPEQQTTREAYEAERREMYRRWDAGDPEVRKLWEMTRQWSLDEFHEILRMLDIHMDVFFFESQVDEPAKRIVVELIRRGVAEDERPDGPVIVRIDEKLGLKKEKYRTAVLLRSDGTTLYLTKDLALAREKFEKYGVDRSIYVVDFRQDLHFQQVFKILELYGFPQAGKCYHLSYGYVTLPEGAMSSRHGTVVLFKEVADEARQRVLQTIAEKNPDLPDRQRGEVADQIGLGAITYVMLSVDSPKDIVFDWNSALSFEGRSAPYIQNAHVRANSILRRGGQIPDAAHFHYELCEEESALIDLISRFPSTAEKAALEYKPLIMANYVYELARSFHAFYHAVPVLQAEGLGVREARLRLTAAARQVLANSLGLLGIRAPEVM